MANTISGRVILKESGAGIPDLLVVLYDKDPGTKSEDALREAPPPIVGHTANDNGDRIGSVLTGSDGRFKLIFEDAEFQIRNAQERRPDLLIKVLAPEEP